MTRNTFTTTRITCDRCKTAAEPPTLEGWGTVSFAQVNGPAWTSGNNKDLCPPCMGSYVEWFALGREFKK